MRHGSGEKMRSNKSTHRGGESARKGKDEGAVGEQMEGRGSRAGRGDGVKVV